jgi:hypothetical protein
MSRRLSYYHAHERAAVRLSTVEVNVSCPMCGELVTCRVDGNDVTIVEHCGSYCHTRSNFDRDSLDGSALAIALGERESYVEHVRGYDDDA